MSERLKEWWAETRHTINRRWINPWYYPIRDWFKPHNVQKIRNTPRSWTDRSDRLLHLVFSTLCDFVEREVCDYTTGARGREGLVARLVWLKADSETNPYVAPQYEAEAETLALYDWYMGVNWTCPDGIDWSKEDPSVPGTSERIRKMEDDWRETETEMLIRAVKNRGGWWT